MSKPTIATATINLWTVNCTCGIRKSESGKSPTKKKPKPLVDGQ